MLMCCTIRDGNVSSEKVSPQSDATIIEDWFHLLQFLKSCKQCLSETAQDSSLHSPTLTVPDTLTPGAYFEPHS